MSPNTFHLPRDRDAFPTIRGYVYQVDLTIQRWLDLDDSQHLELERGEDIDLVSRAIASTDPSETERLLEQVKHREHNLTLRTPAALEAIANAVAHFTANPSITLRFCYTTNADIGTERPCTFPNRTPGIALWERVRRSEIMGDELFRAVSALKQFLS